MIQMDKYTGHTPAPWKADYSFPRYNQIQTGLVGPDGKELGFGYSEEGQIANAELIADAPLLLEEVKRLREQVKKWEDDWIRMANYISHHDKEMYEAIDEDIGWED